MKSIVLSLLFVLFSNVSFAATDLLGSGMFSDYGSHSASGVADIVKVDGVLKLKFSDFKTDRGPDVKVYISKGLWPNEIIDLGKIKKTKGDQEYILPVDDIDLSEHTHVIIWCDKFSVLFGSAKF